jgi:threonine dehydratase
MASGHQHDDMSVESLTRERILEVKKLLQPYVRCTPVLEVRGTDFGLGACRLFFKLESTQYAGSFKARGAFTNLLLRKIPDSGVIAASGGNHGAAVALAARRLGVKAEIFVPRISSPAKIERIRAAGATLHVGGERYDDALAASERRAAETHALTIHAYDSLETMLGTGSVAAELEEQAPLLERIVVAVGGGGLIAGIAAWHRRRVTVVGVEPELAPKMSRALAAGHPVDVEVGGIAADSLGARRAGERVFPVVQAYVERVVTVTDEEIRRAQRALWEHLRVVAEPGGAASFAALLTGREPCRDGEAIGIVVSGGNTTAVDFDR